MTNRIHTYTQYNNLLSFRTGVLLMLSLYVAVFVSSSGAPHTHGAGDHHAEDLCHTDACHIAIYHPGSEGGCNHKTHLGAQEDDCPLCHLVLSRDHIMAGLSFSTQQVDFQTALFHEPDQPVVTAIRFRGGRSPPVSV